MKFGLFANLKREGAEEAIRQFIGWSKDSGNELVLSDELSDLKFETDKFECRQKIAEKVDILVSMGGDGTLLASARAVGSSGTPILGINLGSLGFLTQLTPQELLPALNAIVDGKYQTEKRMVLKMDMNGVGDIESPFALNDIVIDNGAVSRLLDINLKVNGEAIVTYKADGLIISTPTGSTAYSLAAGGPIMNPTMEAFIVSPVAAFSLSTRPMILSAEDKIEIKVVSESHQAMIALDGQVMHPLKDYPTVTISKADYYMNFIVMPGNTFYKVLKNKLHWGYSPLQKD